MYIIIIIIIMIIIIIIATMLYMEKANSPNWKWKDKHLRQHVKYLNLESLALVFGLCYETVWHMTSPNKMHAPHSELQNLENISIN
jgi:lysylphosphatidylglycerol synthetase-like protein (DUF2156 family)